MLEELRRITSTEPYKSYGQMRTKEISITPWNTTEATFVFEIWSDGREDHTLELWEVSCSGVAPTESILPTFPLPTMELALYAKHPILWRISDEIYFSIEHPSDHIAAIMGDLFIEHTKACGNWVDFHWLYAGLPETLKTGRENQLAIPVQLRNACFRVLNKYDVKYSINEIVNKSEEYVVLFFSMTHNWPDGENFKQPYIIAKEFFERRLA